MSDHTHWFGCGKTGLPEHENCPTYVHNSADYHHDQTFKDGDYEAGWADGGAQDSMLRATQYERILTDLIAELRAHSDHAVPVDTLVLESWADRAEQRLKEVTGHE